MRVDLKVPFAEKDAAKAAGARWDPSRKLWYVVDPPSLTRFARWLPGAEASPAKPSAPSRSPRLPKAAPMFQAGSGSQASAPLPDCGCDVLPWEDCEHTAGR